MDQWDLVDNLCDLALSAPADLAEKILRATLAFTTGHRAALFERHQDQLRLSACRGLDQVALDGVQAMWTARREDLTRGCPILEGGAALHPVMAGTDMIGLLVVDTPGSGFGEPRDLQALAQFARVAGHCLNGRRAELAGYLAATSPETVARDHLLVLLDRNEWNIARVARALGVTRPTVYSRMRRYGIERRRHMIGKRPLP